MTNGKLHKQNRTHFLKACHFQLNNFERSKLNYSTHSHTKNTKILKRI